jgi:transaldolase
VAKSGRDFKEVIAEICELSDMPVSAEVSATETDSMIAEGEALAKISDNVVVKLPLTLEGLRACRHFKLLGVRTNVTLCFSANQGLLAAKAGATYVSPFVGRLDDINLDGCELISDLRQIYDNYGFETQILAASVRTANHVCEVAKLGADVATLPPNVIEGLVRHPLTDNGLERFLEDWKTTGQSIL